MALYHKHRPQTFASVVGQEHIVKTIANEVAGDKLAHAYLFSGPRGVGKTTAARILAKAVNCPERKAGKAEPCNACTTCQEIGDGRSIDVIEIDAASHTGVDNVRENIIDNAQFKPTKSPYKVFVIDEVHMLSTPAFNALLKTLEEPPSHVIFILATTELHKLPATIISRCQRFDFKKVGYDTMRAHLQDVAKQEALKIDDEVIGRIINKSDGCVRDAVSLLDQLMSSGEKHITADVASIVLPTSPVEETAAFAAACIRRRTEAGLSILATLAETGVNLAQFATDMLELLRVVMIFQVSARLPALTLDVSDKVKKQLEDLSRELSAAELIALIDLVMKRKNEIKYAPIPQLPLELLVIEWCNNDQPSTINHQQPLKSGADVKPNVQPEKKPEAKKTIVEKVKDMVALAPAIPFETVQASWQAFLTAIEQRSASLSFILKMAELSTVNGNTIVLSAGYPFHRDKLLDVNSRRLIEEILTEILHTTACIDVVVNKSAQSPASSDKDLHELAVALGGEVVQ